MAPSPTIRRLLKETKELSSSAPHPNPTFHAAPLSDDNLHEWHFTLLGPPAPSPYAGGIYHGRITLPHAYPLKPPNFRFLTPSGRFEVNREICLSISGFHEETWQPAWGVRTALVALRGFMGEEGTAGQVGGLESSAEVRKRLANESRLWRCGGCGENDTDDGSRKGATNEERMTWWWARCRDKSVDVEKEVQDIESLPDGMKVEARAVKSNDETQREQPSRQEATSTSSHAYNSQTTETQSSTPHITENFPDHSIPTSTQQNGPESPRRADVSTQQIQNVPTRTQQSSSHHTQGLSQPQTPQRAPAVESVVTIDRAIAGVFFALLLMILKKILYPSSTGLLGGGYDDLRLVRE